MDVVVVVGMSLHSCRSDSDHERLQVRKCSWGNNLTGVLEECKGTFQVLPGQYGDEKKI